MLSGVQPVIFLCYYYRGATCIRIFTRSPEYLIICNYFLKVNARDRDQSAHPLTAYRIHFIEHVWQKKSYLIYLKTFAPSEDLDQPVMFLHVHNEDSLIRLYVCGEFFINCVMYRLTCVFAWCVHICSKVLFLVFNFV